MTSTRGSGRQGAGLAGLLLILLLQTTAACDWPWPRENPHDPGRCDPPCPAGRSCFNGRCVTLDIGVSPDGAPDGDTGAGPDVVSIPEVNLDLPIKDKAPVLHDVKGDDVKGDLKAKVDLKAKDGIKQ